MSQTLQVLGTDSHPSLEVLGKDSPRARIVLDKDSLPSPQRPWQEFTLSPHGLRQGLTPKPVGPGWSHTLELAVS